MLIDKNQILEGGFTIPEEGLSVPEGKSLVMTVDGVVTAPCPGAYSGKVTLSVVDALPAIGKVTLPPSPMHKDGEEVHYEHPYRSAVVVDNGEILPCSALDAIAGAEITDKGIRGGEIRSREDCFNGIMVLDGEYRIEGTRMDMKGSGGDDFELYGTGIGVAGEAKVVIDNTDIETTGCINTAIASCEKSVVLIENSRFKSNGGEPRKLDCTMMAETPWVLGLRGTVRTTNILGASHATFYNCEGESSGWGVYSTDDCNNGTHVIVNSSARITENSPYGSFGYGAYVLGNGNSRFLGADFDTPTYSLVYHGHINDTFVGPSSKENLMRHLGEDSLLYKETNGFADVPEKNTVFRSGRNCVMWHGDAAPMPGTLHVEPGTELYAGEAIFLVKAGASQSPMGVHPGVNPTIDVDGAKLQSDNGVILHFMESDDAGIAPPGSDDHFAPSYTVQEAVPKPFPGHNKYELHGPSVMTARFHNMELAGNIYNSVWTMPQNLNVEIDNVKFSGAVTTGLQYHLNVKPGEAITPANREELGRVGVIPSPNYPCGLTMQLHNESVWTVTDTSYLSMLVLFEGCSLRAPDGKRVVLIVDGVRKEIKPGIYRGDVRVELVNAMEALGSTEIPDPFHGPGMVQANFRHHYESALVVDRDGVCRDQSILDMIQGAEITDQGIRGGVIENEAPAGNGILVKDGDYRIENVKIRSRAHGGDDFEGYGAMITAAGRSNVVVDNLDLESVGAVCTASCAMEYGNLLIENSRLKTTGLDPDTCWADSMTEVPWVLGLKGSVRSTNIVNCATGTYYNCDMISNGWGVISSDDTAEGSTQNVVNTRAVIEKDGIFDSGYVLYSLNAINTRILGSELVSPDYPVTFGGCKKDVYIGPSTRANLEAYIGKDSLLARETNGFADVPEKKSALIGGSNAIMWHHVCAGTVTIEDTELRGGKIALLVKARKGEFMGRPAPTSCPNIVMRRCVLESANRVLFHLSENDDPGMGSDCHDLHWASFYQVPDTSFCDAAGWDASDPDAAETTHVLFEDMALDGNIFNSRFTGCQNLDLVFRGTSIKGCISGGRQYHRQANAGEFITPETPEKLGDVGCLPCEIAGNGVIVRLENGSAWTVDGSSFLSALEIGEGCSVQAPEGRTLTAQVNGETVELVPGKYTGNIHLTVR